MHILLILVSFHMDFKGCMFCARKDESSNKHGVVIICVLIQDSSSKEDQLCLIMLWIPVFLFPRWLLIPFHPVGFPPELFLKRLFLKFRDRCLFLIGKMALLSQSKMYRKIKGYILRYVSKNTSCFLKFLASLLWDDNCCTFLF